jgi:hypothetical protein
MSEQHSGGKRRQRGSASLKPPPREADERKAARESKAEPISKPGGFKNDPDDPTNPNEVRERALRKLRR